MAFAYAKRDVIDGNEVAERSRQISLQRTTSHETSWKHIPSWLHHLTSGSPYLAPEAIALQTRGHFINDECILRRKRSHRAQWKGANDLCSELSSTKTSNMTPRIAPQIVGAAGSDQSSY